MGRLLLPAQLHMQKLCALKNLHRIRCLNFFPLYISISFSTYNAHIYMDFVYLLRLHCKSKQSRNLKVGMLLLVVQKTQSATALLSALLPVADVDGINRQQALMEQQQPPPHLQMGKRLSRRNLVPNLPQLRHPHRNGMRPSRN